MTITHPYAGGEWRRSPLHHERDPLQADACPACRRYRTSTHMLVSLHTEPYSLTEHHGRTASSSALTLMRVNMVHLSAASDGGERGRVVVDDDSRARPRTVWHLTRDMGDDMSPGCHASPCERQEAHTQRLFCGSCERPRHRMRTPIGLLHASGPDACSNPARLRWPCRRRP